VVLALQEKVGDFCSELGIDDFGVLLFQHYLGGFASVGDARIEEI